jgi:PAS domain S-box-containing protein
MALQGKPAVLVVDDEEPIRKLITTLLSIKGYHIRSAASAKEALEIMADEPFDALLTDHMMPGETGLDLILEVNRLYPETVRILLTGVGDRDLYREAINRGSIFSLIEKPFHNQHLLETLEKALDSRFSRLRDRQEILRLKEQYHAVFHNTADLIQCTDTQGGFIYVNPAWHNVLGYREEDLPQISLYDLAVPEQGNRLRNIIRQAGAGKRLKTFETILAAKDGSPVYLEGNATAQVQESGVVAVTCIFRDVTERKLITAELHARLQQETMIARIADLLARTEEPASVYNSILEIVAKSAAADAVFIYSLNDVDQVFTMVESWTSLSGARTPRRYRTIAYHELPWCRDQIMAGETLLFNVATDMPEPDRRLFERWEIGSLLAFPIHIGTCVVGVLGFEVHRRERIWEEREIGMLKAAVDIIANAWTRQMEINVRRQKEIEAEQSRRLVIRADRLAALGTMAAGIIHEITQPLNAINVSTQTILYGLARGWKIEEEKVTGSLNLIVDQVKRMTDIITNMRAFARDGLPTAREVDSLNAQVKRVFTMLGEQMRAHNIEVVFRLGEIPDIRMNTQQILQVILNLVTNARQALDDIDKPDKTIIISTFMEDNSAVLEVIDNGPGVPDTIKEKIFDPFFTTKEVGKGTGLGLSISTGIVHDHKGELDVRNNETGGAAFIMRLPLTE